METENLIYHTDRDRIEYMNDQLLHSTRESIMGLFAGKDGAIIKGIWGSLRELVFDWLRNCAPHENQIKAIDLVCKIYGYVREDEARMGYWRALNHGNHSTPDPYEKMDIPRYFDVALDIAESWSASTSDFLIDVVKMYDANKYFNHGEGIAPEHLKKILLYDLVAIKSALQNFNSMKEALEPLPVEEEA